MVSYGTVNERALHQSVFAVIEHVGSMVLTDTSKNLITAYLEDAGDASTSECARATIRRYLSGELPTLADIRERSQVGALTHLDHLVLKMERAAARVR
jgi:hypothetical protein